MNPKISVIMPVYNTKTFLEDSINSILNQTFGEFEFIIIDDCSNDGSYDILKIFEKKDNRIKLFRNKENKGIGYTRNKLIELSKTNYIASQDSDDISELNRFELEYNFLNNNKEFSVVSGNNIIINEKNDIIGYRKYSNNIRKVILKKSPISQGSSIFKKDIFLKVGGYDDKLNHAEDYDLWLRMYFEGYKIKNSNKFLYKVRIREGQSKSNKLKQTIKNTIFVQKRSIKKYGIKLSFGDKIYHLLEKVLLFLPSNLVLFLFKKLEYKKGN